MHVIAYGLPQSVRRWLDGKRTRRDKGKGDITLVDTGRISHHCIGMPAQFAVGGWSALLQQVGQDWVNPDHPLNSFLIL